MNIYVRDVKTDLKFFSGALIAQKSLAPNAKGKKWRGFYLPLDSRQGTNSKARDTRSAALPVHQRNVIPVDEENTNKYNFLKHQEV